MSFRPAEQLLAEFDEHAAAEGRSRTDVLTSLMDDWVQKKRRAAESSTPAKPSPPPP